MDNQNRKLELLGNAPIPKALLAMGIPTMIGMLINALYNLVDAYFVGGLGESQMAAISVVYPLGQVVVGLGLLFGNGAASYISRLLGQRNKDQANKVASTALYSSLVVGAIMIVLSILFLNPILRLLGATESVLPYAATYAGIYIVSCIFNVFNVTMNNIVTSEGAAKTTMCALLLGAVLNIGLDPLFIYTFNFGVAGAAIATAISQVVSTLVYLFYIFRQKSAFQFRIKDCTFSKEILSEIFKIGVPTLVFQLLTSISISLINNAAGNYGDSAIAGMGVVTRLISMGSLTVFGFIKGFQPIAGYSYGAKKFDRLRTAIKISILSSYGFISSDVKLLTVQTILPFSKISAARTFLRIGVHSTTTILPFLSASKILQLEDTGKPIRRETACSVLSAFSSKYLTIKQELKPAFIFSRSVITKVIATANPCSFTPSSPLMKEEVVILNLFPFFGA